MLMIDTRAIDSKPLWRRGLTEFSLLSRLRGLGQGKRGDSPTRHDRAIDSAPLWRRGLTEFSLLSRLRGIGQGKRGDSPTRHDRSATTVVKVVRRSRPDARQDNIRRRSNSLTNGVPPTILNVPREVAKSLLFFDYENQVW
ncbi:hypothetical protein JYU34_007968 [Plutella xylostella]|uniref:Uncharacterized protein n=1 Tax=Plutella xylostella TaxID=51655 RepID=A0ABQ7QNH8_PLUXY|nr:hypothetical protein JYU34_007968 [Plutella xylostella]